MTGTLSSNMFTLFRYIYRRVFHAEASPEVEKFIKNISYVGIGTVISTIFTFSYNIMAGRLLGPSEYGTFSLIQSVGMILYVPMLLGYHSAMIKYNAEKVNFIRQRYIISTTFLLVLFFTIVSIIFYFIFSKQVMTLFSISGEVYFFGIIFAILFAIYSLTTGALRSIHMIRTYSRLLPLYSAILFLAFIVFIFVFKEVSYKSALFSTLLAYGATGGVILVLIRKFLKPEFNRKWAHELHRYSLFSLIGGVSAALYLNMGRIIINLNMPISDVGIYWAYSFSFTTPLLLLSSIFTTVFFPVASMCSDKAVLFKRINKIVIILLVFGWPLALATGYVILHLYGGSYPIDISLTLLFATAGIFISIDSLYGQLLNSVGIGGAKITSFGAIILALVSVILNILLIPRVGLGGATVASIIAYVSSIIIMLAGWKGLVNT